MSGLGVPRSALHRQPRARGHQPSVDPPWVELLRTVIHQHPTFGYRQLWALLRFQEGLVVNRKAVYRVLKQKRWLVHQRPCTPRPRVRGWISRASRSNERWAMDVTHVPCGRDGWAHLAAVIDCHDREVIGYEFALRSRAQEAERAVETACLAALWHAAPLGAPVLRSDNGLIFQSRRFRQACRDYRLQQEFITPYTPEQNGIIERFFRSLKEECVWQQTFQTFEEARRLIRDWMHWYNQGRPHSALSYRSPVQFRAQQATPRWLDLRGALHLLAVRLHDLPLGPSPLRGLPSQRCHFQSTSTAWASRGESQKRTCTRTTITPIMKRNPIGLQITRSINVGVRCAGVGMW